MKHQLEHERLSATQRKTSQNQLKSLLDGQSVAKSVHYLDPVIFSFRDISLIFLELPTRRRGSEMVVIYVTLIGSSK